MFKNAPIYIVHAMQLHDCFFCVQILNNNLVIFVTNNSIF